MEGDPNSGVDGVDASDGPDGGKLKSEYVGDTAGPARAEVSFCVRDGTARTLSTLEGASDSGRRRCSWGVDGRLLVLYRSCNSGVGQTAHPHAHDTSRTHDTDQNSALIPMSRSVRCDLS